VRPALPASHGTMSPTPPASPSAADRAAQAQATTAVKAAADAQAAANIAKREAARDAALARALQAEEEATTAAWERDTAAQRASDARAHAALERAAADAAIAAPDPSGTLAAPTDLHSAMLVQEAAALLNLHAQAVAVNNVRSLVPIVLGKFSLQDHVCLSPLAPISPDWARMDCIVKSWIIGTLTDDLAEIISAQGSTACDAWLVVESQFLGNREA